MSGRVVPTKPGLWFYRHIELHGLPDSVVTVREPTVEDDDHGTLSGGLVAEFSDPDELLDVGNVNGTWLRPVPSAEAVQAAVSSLRASNKLLSLMLDLGDFGASNVVAGVAKATEKNNNAIAGLTGGEG